MYTCWHGRCTTLRQRSFSDRSRSWGKEARLRSRPVSDGSIIPTEASSLRAHFLGTRHDGFPAALEGPLNQSHSTVSAPEPSLLPFSDSTPLPPKAPKFCRMRALSQMRWKSLREKLVGGWEIKSSESGWFLAEMVVKYWSKDIWLIWRRLRLDLRENWAENINLRWSQFYHHIIQLTFFSKA